MDTPENPPIAGTARTFAELLRARAEQQPERLGYTFLADGETARLPLTYAQADLHARAIATRIREAGAVPGERALLLLPPGLDYIVAFFGCLYAGVVAVPAYPPDPFQLERTLPRLLAIVRDATPVIALTASPLLGYLDQLPQPAPELHNLRWIPVDTGSEPGAAAREPIPVDPQSPAVLQYTSGSTAAPRGVMLSHRHLLHNSAHIQHLFGATPESRGLAWLPPYHDMGLIGGILQPLYAGCPVTLLSPLHFLEDPMRWLRAIDRFQATISGGPNFAYDLCARRSTPDQAAQLDLSSWQVAFNGAEPVRPETLRRFTDTFAPAGFPATSFLPCYGLAEATLIVSGSSAARVVPVDRRELARHVVTDAADGSAVNLTSCGQGVPDQRIAIVDPATGAACPPNRVGEIWVCGPSVAAGYWGRPDETDQVFRARLPDGDGPYLRTGDLGFLSEGELIVTGRLKDLIIIRGQNHYPQDIERTAEQADPALRPGGTAAFLATEDEEEPQLILVHEVRRQTGEVDTAEIGARVRHLVAQEHGLRVHTVALIRAGGVPKTSSGKVQRWLCRTRYLAAELPELGRDETVSELFAGTAAPDPGLPGAAQVLATAPEHRSALVEGYLRGQVATVSGVRPDVLDPHQPLLAAGLDSLTVVQLKHRLETDLGVSLSLGPILAGAGLSDVVEEVVGQLGEPRPAPAGGWVPAAGTDASSRELVAPMSHGQRWMWLLQQLEPDNPAYTVATALRLPGPVDRSALRRALDTLVSRHPVLRTTFPVRGEQPVQLVAPNGRAALQEHDARELDQAALRQRLIDAARRPFDLESGPLLRLELYQAVGGDLLSLSMHHIITDFWSMTILANELGAYYSAYATGREPALPPPAATYLDVVARQQSILDDQELTDRLARYWDRQVGDGVPALALPAITRTHTAPKASPEAGCHYFSLPPALTHRLRARAAAERVTLYVLLLTAFQSTLHHLSGQPDLAVGAGVAARTCPEFAEVVGGCSNSVMIRSRTAAGDTFRDLLYHTRDQVIGALEHQDYPTTLLARRQRAAGRGSRLFEVLFAFNRSPRPGDDLAALATLGPPGVRRRLGLLEVESFPLPPGASRFPIELVMAEVEDAVRGLLRYSTDSLDEPSAAGLARQFAAVLERVADDPDSRLEQLPVAGLAVEPAVSRNGPRTGQPVSPAPVSTIPPQ